MGALTGTISVKIRGHRYQVQISPPGPMVPVDDLEKALYANREVFNNQVGILGKLLTDKIVHASKDVQEGISSAILNMIMAHLNILVVVPIINMKNGDAHFLVNESMEVTNRIESIMTNIENHLYSEHSISKPYFRIILDRIKLLYVPSQKIKLNQSEINNLSRLISKYKSQIEELIAEKEKENAKSERVLKEKDQEIDELKKEKEIVTLSKDIITNSIVVPKELQEAGLSILVYFSEIINIMYPEKEIDIEIRRNSKEISFCIKSKEVDMRIIKETLYKYGQVVREEIPANELLDNPIKIRQLENQVSFFKGKLAEGQDMLELRDSRLRDYKEQVKQLTTMSLMHNRTINNLINKSSNDKKVEEILSLIKFNIEKDVLSEDDKDKMYSYLMEIKESNPRAISYIKDFCLGTSSSITATYILQILKTLGL